MPNLASKKEHYFGGSPEAPTLDNATVSERWDAYIAKVDASPARPIDREHLAGLKAGQPIDFNVPTQRTAADVLNTALAAPDLAKALGSDAIASISAAIDAAKTQVPDLVKDITLTSPLSTGLVAYDLEAPAKLLIPRVTPIRNRIPRRPGRGIAHRWKVINGFTNSRTGAAGGLVHPGILDTTQTNFAPSGAGQSLYFARGAKISYSGADVAVNYKQFSLSDEVNWSAQYAGQGFQDVRQLSRTSLLYSSMLAEEHMLLGARSTDANATGAVAAPTGLSGTARALAGSEVGISGATTNVYVKVTSESLFGESVLSSATTVAVTNGQVVDVTWTDKAGATGYRVYVSTGASDPGDASRWYIGRTGYNKFTVTGALPTSGKAASTVTADTTATALGYDGILPICQQGFLGTASGYSARLNAAFSTTNPGSEFQTAFAAMFDVSLGGVMADPDRIMINGLDRKQLSDALQKASSSNYTLRVTQDELTGVTVGSVAAAVLNEVTGKRVDLEVHPYLPQGNACIISDTLPVPDSNVSDCWAAWNVQDYMGVDWPINQFTFESSSYWFGTFGCYAPQWQGYVGGITKV